MVNTELPAVTIPFTRPSRFWRHGVRHEIRGRILLTFVQGNENVIFKSREGTKYGKNF